MLPLIMDSLLSYPEYSLGIWEMWRVVQLCDPLVSLPLPKEEPKGCSMTYDMPTYRLLCRSKEGI